jgi:hypothetical protein
MKKLLLLTIFLAGCLSPDKSWGERAQKVSLPGGEPWDSMAQLLRADPSAVTSGDLLAHAQELERRYLTDVEVEGVVWQPLRSNTSLAEPDIYGSGGDSLLFTGMALAGWVWKHQAEPSDQALLQIKTTLRGLWILTHAAGDGVLLRCAYPASRDTEWNYPAAWGSRIEEGFLGVSVDGLAAPFGNPLSPMRWYSRATKDQLTGLVFGLAVAWSQANDVEIQNVIREIAMDVYQKLKADNWQIRDNRGSNDTTADDVDSSLRLALLSLVRAVGSPEGATEFQKEWDEFVGFFGILGVGDRYNNLQQYYAHNLRAMRAFTLWVLADDLEHKEIMVEYSEEHWRQWTEGHQNAWLSWLWSAMSGESDEGGGFAAMQSLSIKPLRLWSSPLAGQNESPGFFAVTFNTTADWALPVHLRKPSAYSTWQKEPWDAGDLPYDTQGLMNSTGVDFLAAYWLGRAYRLSE